MKLEKVNPFVKARLELGFKSAPAFSSSIGISKNKYWKWETGKVSFVNNRSVIDFDKICKAFGWSKEEGKNNLSNMYQWVKDKNVIFVDPVIEPKQEPEKLVGTTGEMKKIYRGSNPLKQWRYSNNLTEAQAAEKCKVDLNVYTACEDGITKPNGTDTNKIMTASGLSFTEMARLFKKEPPIIERDLDGYPANFIVKECGLPNEDWIFAEFRNQMEWSSVGSTKHSIFSLKQAGLIIRVFKRGNGYRLAGAALGITGEHVEDIVRRAKETFQNHIFKLMDKHKIVVKIPDITKIPVEELPVMAKETPKEGFIKKDICPTSTISDMGCVQDICDGTEPEIKVISDNTKNGVGTIEIEEPIKVNTDIKNVVISQGTAKMILDKLYGELEATEYITLVSEMTKGGLLL